MVATRLLAVAGVVLAIGGATVIALAAAARTAPQVPLSSGSEELVSEVSSTESNPGLRRLPVEGKTLRPLTALAPRAGEANDPVPLSPSEPTSIEIPAIGVHSRMQQVGLTPQHTLEVPAPGPHYDEAAWYRHSATPGAMGTAIVVGHVDSARNGPSVFFDLGKLRPGDEVLVTRGDGTVAIFRVDSVRRYPKDEFPTELVYGSNGSAALRMITCGGVFDRDRSKYLDNVVVFATFVGVGDARPS